MATYRELIVRGDDKMLKGFLHGFVHGRGMKGGLIFAGDHPIKQHHVRDFLKLHGPQAHIIADAQHYRSLNKAIARAKELGIEIVSDRKIVRAYFDFHFETFNRRVASRIKRILSTLPSGVKLVGYKPAEEFRPEAKGVEVYTPVHHYTFRGKGRITGDLVKLLRIHARARDDEFIDADDITLEH